MEELFFGNHKQNSRSKSILILVLLSVSPLFFFRSEIGPLVSLANLFRI